MKPQKSKTNEGSWIGSHLFMFYYHKIIKPEYEIKLK